jgi:hypothetical protein
VISITFKMNSSNFIMVYPEGSECSGHGCLPTTIPTILFHFLVTIFLLIIHEMCWVDSNHRDSASLFALIEMFFVLVFLWGSLISSKLKLEFKAHTFFFSVSFFFYTFKTSMAESPCLRIYNDLKCICTILFLS